jgi:extradiol dioxygenase family protein
MPALGVERTDFVNVATQDLERAKRFYGEVLGLPRNGRSSDQWPEFETGNLTLLLAASPKTGLPFSHSNNAIALPVPNVDEAKTKLEQAGFEFDFETVYDNGRCRWRSSRTLTGTR